MGREAEVGEGKREARGKGSEEGNTVPLVCAFQWGRERERIKDKTCKTDEDSLKPFTLSRQTTRRGDREGGKAGELPIKQAVSQALSGRQSVR